MQPARAALTVLLACAMSGAGCDSPEPKPWDGSYVALDERGDWVDTGPLAHCRVLEDSEAKCGSLESFDLSLCRSKTLSKLERQGVFRAELRFDAPEDAPAQERPRARGGGFKLRANGTPELVFGSTQVDGRWDPEKLWLSGRGPDGTVYSFAACQARDERTVTGCFSVCREGQRVESATFRAERMSWFPGEGYASGGFQRLSEASVEGLPRDVHVTGGHAFVVSESREGRPGGLTVFDVSDPFNPSKVGYLRQSGAADWRGVTSAGSTLYVASAASGVLVFDITHPADPDFVRSLPGGPLRVSSVRTDGDRLYASVESPQPGTLMFDISTPAAPRLLHQLGRDRQSPRPLAGPSAVAYEGLLYVNHGPQGFKV
ncbi:MAG TPA: hypothetical protein VE153_22145, partial [Myxococcus sp.]|nr:hypothetical protein [Myxococcus sp.]